MDNNIFLSCSSCHGRVVKSVGNEIKIRSKVLLFSDEKGPRAVCKGCGSELFIPLSLDVDMIKSLAKDSSPRLYLSSSDTEDEILKKS